jgi:hypothetical protein
MRKTHQKPPTDSFKEPDFKVWVSVESAVAALDHLAQEGLGGGSPARCGGLDSVARPIVATKFDQDVRFGGRMFSGNKIRSG